MTGTVTTTVTVGPAPCFNPGLNLIAVAMTAAKMAKRVGEGKEIGSMFVTDPQASEYELYQMAKAQREAMEAEQAGARAQERAVANERALPQR